MQVSPRLTVITLGVSDMARAIAFYDRLGLERRMKATGEQVAFYKAGAMTLALYPTGNLADEAGVARASALSSFREVTLAWNCNSPAEVEAGMAHAIKAGAKLIKSAQKTEYGGVAGYFADPDGHVWEIVTAPGIEVQADGRVSVPA